MDVTLITWRIPTVEAADVEAAALAADDLDPRLLTAREHLGVPHLAYLATCQRVVWALQDAPPDAETRLRALYAQQGRQVGRAEVFRSFAAFEHLAEVASSLDALVPGEPQVLGQVRQAMLHCDRLKILGTELRHVFDHVLRTAKEVRSSTALFQGKVSLLPLVEEQVREALPEGASAAVMGTGATAVQAVALLRRLRPDLPVTVVSRDPRRAKAFARQHGTAAAALGPFLEQRPPDLAVLLCAMRTERPLLSAALLAQWARQAPLLVVDLALPRNTKPVQGEGLTLVQMDDFTRRMEAGRARRSAAYAEAREVLAQAVARVRQAYEERCLAEEALRLSTRFQAVAEERWRHAGLPQDPRTRKWYDQTVRALLHEALQAVKDREAA